VDDRLKREFAIAIVRILSLVVVIILCVSVTTFMQPHGTGQTRGASTEARLEVHENKLDGAREAIRTLQDEQRELRRALQAQENEMSSLRGMGQGVGILLGILQTLGLVLQFKKPPNGKP
jgi:hypothetical protein